MAGEMERVVVVGAGLSGVACARELVAAGVPVRVVDRGRRVGGRMASKRLDGRPVDLGASYFTAGDDDFLAVAEDWERRGLATRWTDTFQVLAPDADPRTSSGPVRWGAPGGLRSLVEDLADGLDVEHGELDAVPDAAVVVLAMPDPQALRVLDGSPATPVLEEVRSRLDRRFEPVLALAATFAERTWDLDGAFVNDHDVLAWVADDGRRRGDDASVLVAHSTPVFAEPHLADPPAAAGPMTAALRELLDLDDPVATHVHRWTFAKPAGERDDPFLLVEGPGGGLVGACGDGWGPASKVETAWLSGQALGRELVRRTTQ
jgi:renalase